VLIEVTNPDRPEIRPHLARLWPSEHLFSLVNSDEELSIAALPPTLAHNLGLALHITPLLAQPREGDNSITHEAEEDGDEKISNLKNNKATPHARVFITPYIPSPPSIPDTSSSEGEKEYKDEEDDEIEYATFPQPPPFEAVQIPVAQELYVSVVREPITCWSPPGVDGQHPAQQHQQHSYTSFLEDDTAESAGSSTDPVLAIQKYFLGGLRVVCEGDILAVPKHGIATLAEIMNNISLPLLEEEEEQEEEEEYFSKNSKNWEFSRFIFFKVSRVVPNTKAIQAIDVGSTMVKLSGTCSSTLPVGLRGYLNCSTSNNLVSLLGWNAGAASLPRGWTLPFVGELLPSWRRIAHPLATLMHPASNNFNLKVAMLVHGPSGAGKRTAIAAAAAAVGCHTTFINCRDIKGEGALPDSKVAEGLRVAFDIAGRYRPCILILEEFHLMGSSGEPHADAAAARLSTALAECIAAGADRSHLMNSLDSNKPLFTAPVVLIATAPAPDDVPSPLRRCFTHEILIDAPSAAARERLLRSFMGTAGSKLTSEQWEDLARHTAGLLPRDLRSFAADACAAAALETLDPLDVLLSREEKKKKKNEGVVQVEEIENIPIPNLNDLHISSALNSARERMATDIGAPKIPNVEWDDVGGLEDVKISILDTVELPLKHPELFSGGLRRRSGVLLYGPPGTGKTLLAKAVATECAVNFLSVKGPELINMYVGESERQIREIFARARRARPCVVFFDELDSLAPARGRGSDSGGVMDRVVSQLLAEIDSAQSGSGTDDVFIIGATNRPDLLDPALLRPGRLDKLLFVGVASDATSQLKVIKALTRKFAMDRDVELEIIAEKCPPRLTGADLYALCSDAWMVALKRRVASSDSDSDGDDDDKEEKEEGDASSNSSVVVVKHIDFENALLNLRPSLSEEDIQKYELIRDQYAGTR
jgi:SpoVK/Ycf46/Vps4 family AAA+-type ATPase